MSFSLVTELYVFVLACFVGYLVITRVPPLLHTPLMSATNAISAISLVGSLVAAGSPAFALELVRWSQRRIHPRGYRQAVHCLAQGRLADDARRFAKKVLVACGNEDIITPEAGCKAIAAAFPRAEYRTLPGIGHAPQIEAPEAINQLIAGFVPR